MIEELDAPAEHDAGSTWPLTLLRRFGRRRMSAVIAGVLIGAFLSASAPATTAIPSCQPTTTRDPSGMITVDGNVGIIGETFTRSGDGAFLVARRGAVTGDSVSLQFTQVGTSAPATWVQYSSSATEQPTKTPWGDRAAFPAGWKPIAFGNSCWRLIVDGRDSGIVLGVGPD